MNVKKAMNKDENIYLFIIWNSALWCRDRIIKDLNKTFDIKLNVFIEWDKNKIKQNLESLYGSKIDSIKEKVKSTGTGPFNLIVIGDKNPKYEIRKVHNSETFANVNVFDKKELYRKWTGQSFRVHSSIDVAETKHDLVVLFGKDYLDILKKHINDDFINLNTKTVEGFSTKEDIINCLSLFGNCITYEKEDELYIFCKCMLDTNRFLLPCLKISSNCFKFSINGLEFIAKIYGEEEGDLPTGFINKSNNNDAVYLSLISIIDEYDVFLSDRKNVSEKLKAYYNKFEFELNTKKFNTLRINPKESFIKRIKLFVKYIIARIECLKENRK